MTIKFRSIFYVLFLMFSLIGKAQTFPIHKTTEKITVDGDLSDWKKPFLGPFVVHNSGEKATQKTFVSLSWNNENLFIAYRSEDSKIIGETRKKDAPLFRTDDLVEIFLDPDGNGQNYVEIGVNAFSSNYDILVECLSDDCGGFKVSKTFDIAQMETASKITPEGFSTEIKIPFSSLVSIQNGNFTPPEIGTKWKGNTFRIDFGNSTEYLALQPYASKKFSFHQPEEFANFEFME